MIVVDEATGLPYKEGTCRHWGGEVRRAAVHGVARLAGETAIASSVKYGIFRPVLAERRD